MNPFAYVTADDAGAALAQVASPGPGTLAAQVSAHAAYAAFIAGGTNLIDLMKENITRPARLVDISRVPLAAISETAGGGLLLGALASNADTAWHPLVQQRYPLLSAAILAGASPQIRNMATNGGNLLQRTRCYYFYDAGVPCNKRLPGSGCPAIGGLNRQHAILGASDSCIATNPSDMAVALVALDAIVHVQSLDGRRTIPFADFHRLPGAHPERDSNLARNELITHIELPPAPALAAHSTYLKLRDRASYAFALVSVAAALNVADDGSVAEVRVALGGVAHKPWRLPQAEALLVGQRASAEQFAKLADALLDGAVGQGQNDFKIALAHRAVVRALEMALAGTLSLTPITTDTTDGAAP
jgi:xanthine dehydrogenase YagS FAD-binding subunit